MSGEDDEKVTSTLDVRGRRKGRPGQLDAKTQRHLGQLIKESYAELVDQPVPDRFLELLNELDKGKDK